jgi:hypothetical protein
MTGGFPRLLVDPQFKNPPHSYDMLRSYVLSYWLMNRSVNLKKKTIGRLYINIKYHKVVINQTRPSIFPKRTIYWI